MWRPHPCRPNRAPRLLGYGYPATPTTREARRRASGRTAKGLWRGVGVE
jgi:hypothetical protein